MSRYIIPTLKTIRVVSYVVLMTILMLAFGFDVDFVIRFWPALLCGILAISMACDAFLGIASGTLSIASVSIRRATHPKIFFLLCGINLLISVMLAGIGVHLLLQRLT